MDPAAGLAIVGAECPAVLRNGRTIDIAVPTVDDTNEIRRFYEQLSDTSTYYRFFGIRRALPTSELRATAVIDVPRHVTLVARDAGSRRLIGLGEFIATDDPGDAEVAFAVADDHHGEGVATLLLERLAAIAQRCGYRRLVAHVLPGNHDMLLVFSTVGLAEQHRFDGGIIDVSLDLADLHGLEVRSANRGHGCTPPQPATAPGSGGVEPSAGSRTCTSPPDGRDGDQSLYTRSVESFNVGAWQES